MFSQSRLRSRPYLFYATSYGGTSFYALLCAVLLAPCSGHAQTAVIHPTNTFRIVVPSSISVQERNLYVVLGPRTTTMCR